MEIPFEIGQEYNRRRQLHELYGGSRQSGMCPSSSHPFLFLFTGSGGEQHGYHDRFVNGLFLYTGEGQSGDMRFIRGNRALRDHIQDGRHVLLFEQSSKGFCRFRGEHYYVGHHFETRPDTSGASRQAIVFELACETLEVVENQSTENREEPIDTPRLPKNMSLQELRQLAKVGESPTIKTRSIRTRQHYRSIAVKRYALARAEGTCECCNTPAPFLTKQKTPYLEVHHLFRVADGGPDTPEGVAAICPTCHRRIHNGADGAHVNAELSEHIKELEHA